MTTKIRKLSPKRASQYREYLKLRAEYLAAKPICECCKWRPATDCHHQKGKIGAMLTNVAFFLSVCRECHYKIEHNPTWAKENGFSLSRLAV